MDLCKDCGIGVDTSRPHMIKDKLWLKINSRRYDGVLCISCIQNRLGRKLTKEDFYDKSSYVKLQNTGILPTDKLYEVDVLCCICGGIIEKKMVTYKYTKLVDICGNHCGGAIE